MMDKLKHRLATRWGYEKRGCWRRIVIPQHYVHLIQELPVLPDEVSFWHSAPSAGGPYYVDRFVAEKDPPTTSYISTNG